MSFLNNLNISRKLAFSFAVLVFATILMAGILLTSIQTIRSADEKLAHASKLGEGYLHYTEVFAEQRQGLLFYMLTGDRAGLETYHAMSAGVNAAYNELWDEAEGDDETTDLVDEMARYYEEWVAIYALEQIRLMRNYLTVNEARAIESTGEPGALIKKYEDVAHQLNDRLVQISAEADIQKQAAMTQFLITIIVAIVALIFISIFFAIALSRIIAKPIGEMTAAMGDLAKGNLEVEIPGAGREDEVGGMAQAVEIFKQNAIERRALREEENRMQEAERERHERLEKLAMDFDGRMAEGLRVVTSSVNAVAESSSTMAGNATETGALSQDASSSILEASGNIQTVSSATTELSSSVGEISTQMAQVAAVSREAVEEIEQTSTRVTSLNEAAESIGQVVQIISDIAEQTNLLALNATIESARAGDAGKGFAVVANEVKNLAGQTGKATEEISAKITEIQGETGAASDAVMTIKETIGKIDELTAAVASAVEEQGAATGEIARNVEEASAGTEQVTNVVHEVARAAEDTGKLAEQQQSVVAELNANNTKLKQDIDQFLSDVKAI